MLASVAARAALEWVRRAPELDLGAMVWAVAVWVGVAWGAVMVALASAASAASVLSPVYRLRDPTSTMPCPPMTAASS